MTQLGLTIYLRQVPHTRGWFESKRPLAVTTTALSKLLEDLALHPLMHATLQYTSQGSPMPVPDL
eukprot:5092830-Amphidinium_carterae.1